MNEAPKVPSGCLQPNPGPTVEAAFLNWPEAS